MTSGAAHLMGNLVPSEAVYSSSATQRARPKSATLTMFRRPTKQLRAAWKEQQRKQVSYRSPCSLLFAAHTPTHPNPPPPPTHPCTLPPHPTHLHPTHLHPTPSTLQPTHQIPVDEVVDLQILHSRTDLYGHIYQHIGLVDNLLSHANVR